MLEFKLSKDYEQVSKANPFGLKYTPLKHQYETYQALQENEIVMNLHNTGTGKTLASLLYLFDLKQKRDNVLFIAPTNELIYQHSQDIKEFLNCPEDQELMTMFAVGYPESDPANSKRASKKSLDKVIMWQKF